MIAKEREIMVRKSIRLAAAFTLTLAAVGGGAIASTAPAFAVQPTCSFQMSHGITPTAVTGYFYYVCTSPPEHEPLTVDLYRNSTLVATGSGTATYTCNGSTENYFSIDGSAPFQAACG
jgi:hypothetical protein